MRTFFLAFILLVASCMHGCGQDLPEVKELPSVPAKLESTLKQVRNAVAGSQMAVSGLCDRLPGQTCNELLDAAEALDVVLTKAQAAVDQYKAGKESFENAAKAVALAAAEGKKFAEMVLESQ